MSKELNLEEYEDMEFLTETLEGNIVNSHVEKDKKKKKKNKDDKDEK